VIRKQTNTIPAHEPITIAAISPPVIPLLFKSVSGIIIGELVPYAFSTQSEMIFGVSLFTTLKAVELSAA
jgi:hypothetical protein